METTIILFCLINLAAPMVLQNNLRPYTDNLSLEPNIQIQYTPLQLTNSDMLMQGILRQSKIAEVRRRRAAPKGCQFGTCQMHNLASTLYRMGQTNNKDQSKDAKDPNGYGR